MALSTKHRKLAVAGMMSGTFTASLHKADGTELAGNGYARANVAVTLDGADAIAKLNGSFPAASAAWPDVAKAQIYDAAGDPLFTAPSALTVGGVQLVSVAEAEVLRLTDATVSIL